MEKSETAPMTYEAARRLLLDYALKKHLIQEEEAVALLKEAGFTRKTLVVEFGRAWKVLKEAGEARVPGL